MKVVVASEDPRIRAWVSMALGPSWEYIEASDGLEARSAVQAHHPALLVADETMERYGAFGMSRDIKMASDPPAIIVLLERAQDGWLAKWSGADRWLVRPVDPFVLSDTARELTGAAARAASASKRTVKEETA